jgi:hypothetical protein
MAAEAYHARIRAAIEVNVLVQAWNAEESATGGWRRRNVQTERRARMSYGWRAGE